MRWWIPSSLSFQLSFFFVFYFVREYLLVYLNTQQCHERHVWNEWHWDKSRTRRVSFFSVVTCGKRVTRWMDGAYISNSTSRHHQVSSLSHKHASSTEMSGNDMWNRDSHYYSDIWHLSTRFHEGRDICETKHKQTYPIQIKCTEIVSFYLC